MTDYSALIARLEKESGEDRWLDGLLAPIDPRLPTGWVQHPYAAESGPSAWMAGEFWPSEAAFKHWRDHNADIENWVAPAYTRSLNAALAFAEAAAPAWTVHYIHHGKRLWTVHLCRRGNAEIETDGEHESFARAILIATLKALRAKDTP